VDNERSAIAVINTASSFPILRTIESLLCGNIQGDTPLSVQRPEKNPQQKSGSDTRANSEWEGIHDPTDNDGDKKEGKENEHPILELGAGRVLGRDGKHHGNEGGENRQRFEVRKSHGLRPCAIS
jgi:hypothetical protein